MAEMFASGRIVDCILAFMLIEWMLLALLRRRSNRGLNIVELTISLSAGLALLLALRASLAGSGWPTVALWLSAALVAHLCDLRLRWTAARTR